MASIFIILQLDHKQSFSSIEPKHIRLYFISLSCAHHWWEARTFSIPSPSSSSPRTVSGGDEELLSGDWVHPPGNPTHRGPGDYAFCGISALLCLHPGGKCVYPCGCYFLHPPSHTHVFFPGELVRVWHGFLFCDLSKNATLSYGP